MIDHIKDLLAHSEWADAVLYGAWAKTEVAREDTQLRERASHVNGVPSLFLDLLNGVDVLPWEKIMSGEAKPPWADQPLKTFEELKVQARSNYARFKEFAAGLDETSIRGKLTVPWFPEPPCVLSVAEALTQVVMHTQHHRGQQMTRLKQIGGQAKNVDYIIWVWKERPMARWD